jgi:hypothetical protein
VLYWLSKDCCQMKTTKLSKHFFSSLQHFMCLPNCDYIQKQQSWISNALRLNLENACISLSAQNMIQKIFLLSWLHVHKGNRRPIDQ